MLDVDQCHLFKSVKNGSSYSEPDNLIVIITCTKYRLLLIMLIAFVNCRKPPLTVLKHNLPICALITNTPITKLTFSRYFNLQSLKLYIVKTCMHFINVTHWLCYCSKNVVVMCNSEDTFV